MKSGFLSGVLQSTVRGLRYCEMQGDINQQGGAFILGPGWCNGRIILSLSADVCFY